jgi:hypothetical protein
MRMRFGLAPSAPHFAVRGTLSQIPPTTSTLWTESRITDWKLNKHFVEIEKSAQKFDSGPIKKLALD